MCAECHSTNVKKNYDATQPRYTTSWTDISVNCEACHGAGSAHVCVGKAEGGQAGDRRGGWDWWSSSMNGRVSPGPSIQRPASACGAVRAGPTRKSRPAGSAMPVARNSRTVTCRGSRSRRPTRWHCSSPASSGRMGRCATRSTTTRRSSRAGCIARASPAATAMTRTRSSSVRPGAQVCVTCHAKEKYQGPSHDHHPAGTPQVDCVSCHMPRSRSWSSTRGMTTASACHARSRRCSSACRTPATSATGSRRPSGPRTRWRSGTVTRRRATSDTRVALHESELGVPGSQARLIGLAGDTLQPAIARATAVSRLAGLRITQRGFGGGGRRDRSRATASRGRRRRARRRRTAGAYPAPRPAALRLDPAGADRGSTCPGRPWSRSCPTR